jgi:hypothetical protein
MLRGCSQAYQFNSKKAACAGRFFAIELVTDWVQLIVEIRQCKKPIKRHLIHGKFRTYGFSKAVLPYLPYSITRSRRWITTESCDWTIWRIVSTLM